MEPCANETQGQEKLSIRDEGFVWQDYLDATASVEVPQIMFPHVESSLQSGIEIGMSLEVPTRIDEEPTYWVASIVMACGPLLRLRYFGGDDRSLEFWCNLTKEAAHELGWSVRNNKKLEPPKDVLERSPDCMDKLQEYLMSARSVPMEMLTGDGLSMTDRIKQGMKVEARDSQHPYKLWPAMIRQNVGGRLLLRYDTPDSLFNDFWVFCTSERLHHYGFASEEGSNWFLEPPSSIVKLLPYEEWKALTESSLKDYERPNNLFENGVDHTVHKFEVGMKLEAISPTNRVGISPATVVKVFDDTYFLVKIDVHEGKCENRDEQPVGEKNDLMKDTWLCTAEHPYIFPIEWAKKNGIRITHPTNWVSKSEEFDWNEYLTETDSKAAAVNLFPERESGLDAGFEPGMRLEAVDPENESIICAAHITKIVANLLWIKLDNEENHRPEHIVSMHSMQIFPVGWCESNTFPLRPPKDFVDVCKKLERPQNDSKKTSILDIPISEPRSSLWCPKIYFNYRCFTGPMISKGKLATLPKAVGPGPVTLVMREVLSMIVSVGYRSARILKVLQCDSKPDPGYHLEVLKAKHKENTYRASVAVVTSGDMVAEFCKNICKKLMVCPNLFGPQYVPENECPEKCQKVTKPKFVAAAVRNGGAKRGKPKGYTSILVQRPKAWRGRKRRRGRWGNRWTSRNKEEDTEENAGENNEEPQEVSQFEPYEPLGPLKLEPEDVEEIENEENRPQLSEIDIMIQKGLDKTDDIRTEVPSSNVSEDSRSSFNDRKSKESHWGSPSSSCSKTQNVKGTRNGVSLRQGKRERECETSIESDYSDTDAQNEQMKRRRPKTRKLESNPLFWSVDDVFRYLRKTADCKNIAHRVRHEEIDGLAFLLLNLPSITQHMKLRTSSAMKLCRHVEQVKVTFFLRHINEVEPEQYQIL